MQFLDITGLRALWAKIKAGDAAAKTTISSGTAHATNPYITATGTAVSGSGQDGHTDYVLTLNNVASPTDVQNAKQALYGGSSIPAENPLTLTSLNTAISNATTGAAVTVEKQASAESGYAATYVVKQNNTQVGVKINIPKDFLVKSGSVKTCSTADTPVTGYVVGDKYLDFVVNTISYDGTDSHIYILVKDLVDVYTGGNGISVSNANEISVTVDTALNGNEFLSVGANGLKVSGVSTAIGTAKSEVIGESTDTASADTIYGAKAYADAAITAASSDYATAAQGDLADTALQSISHGTDSNYITITVGTKSSNSQTVSGSATVQAMSSADSSHKGLAEASDVKSYVSGIVNGLDADLDATGTAQHSGTFVVSGVTEANGVITGVDSVEVESAGAAAAVESTLRGDTTSSSYSATETLTSLRASIDAIGGSGSGSIADQIATEIGKLDSAIVASTITNHSSNNVETEPETYVFTGIQEVDGKLSSTASGTTSIRIMGIPSATLDTILV